jgi:hypothetical protein
MEGVLTRGLVICQVPKAAVRAGADYLQGINLPALAFPPVLNLSDGSGLLALDQEELPVQPVSCTCQLEGRSRRILAQ